MIPDFTVLVALDIEHLEEFRVSFPTWVKNWPAIQTHPIRIICDALPLRKSGVNDWFQWWKSKIDVVLGRSIAMPASVGKPCGDIEIQCWGRGDGFSQRGRMLNSLVFGAASIETPYYLKIDTDAICLPGAENWINPEWFDGSPAIIGHKWSYTKPWHMLEDLDAWAAKLPEFATAPPLARTVCGDKAKHPRIISYCMFGRTDFTRRVAQLAGDWLPVPSQDSFLGYCCTRLGETMVRTKIPGWKHVGGGGRRLREAAAEAMRG